MQGIMCVDDVELDPSLFQIPGSQMPVISQSVVDITANRSAQTIAVVELGKQLLVAAKDGQVELVRELMSKGAPFTTDWLGVSPLHLAVQNNHVETAEVLLRAGISQEARTKVDRTPLHMAAQGGHQESVELLLRHGADVNCCDMLRMTPLHWAVENQNAEVITTLLKAGADPHAQSKFDKTPVSMAKDLGRTDLVEILKRPEYAAALEAARHPSTAMDQESLAATESLAAELAIDHQEINQQLNAAPPSPKKPRVRIQMESKQVMVTIPSTTTSRSLSFSKAQTPKRVSTASSGAAAKATFSLGSEASPMPTLPSPGSSPVNNSTFQLLQAHGITMLPTDESTTVESAMESGQTVVLTEAGKMALNLTRVGGRLIGYPKGKPLNNVASGGVQKKTPVLGSKSRIIKIHPSQLVALGGGRVQVPSQLVMQQGKSPNILKRVAIAPNTPIGTIKTVPVNTLNRVQRVMIAPQHAQQIPHLLQPKPKEAVQQIQIQQSVQNELPILGVGLAEPSEGDYEEEENEEPPMPTDLATIAQELANARKQAAEFRKQLAKKEKEAELYLQQLRSIKGVAQ